MITPLNTFLNQLLSTDNRNFIDGDKHRKRWVYIKSTNQLIYGTNPRKSNLHGSEKMEVILKIMAEKLSKSTSTGSFSEKLNLAKLRNLISTSTANYGKKHSGFLGFFYILFSRIIYGRLDKLAEGVIQQIDRL